MENTYTEEQKKEEICEDELFCEALKIREIAESKGMTYGQYVAKYMGGI